MTSNAKPDDLDKIVTKAAAEKYHYGDGRGSVCGPTSLFAALDLRYAPIVRPASLVSTVPHLDDDEFNALVEAGVQAGYFVHEDSGLIVTFAGHRRARNVRFGAGQEYRLYFDNLLQGTVSLEDAVLLHVSDGIPRNYPVWFGELGVAFPNAGRIHIDDIDLTPLPTTAGNRAAAQLRLRDDVRELMKPVSRELSHARPGNSQLTTRVFIGHGGAPDWRELKDFIQDRLVLEVVEFNTVPTAGIATMERLEEMLESSAFAFIVATAEDLAADGSVHARENVIHEMGLFQGRLGFRRAIVVLERGCAEFSNITGVGQLRFPRSNISSTFEDVRRLLEERLPTSSWCARDDNRRSKS